MQGATGCVAILLLRRHRGVVDVDEAPERAQYISRSNGYYGAIVADMLLMRRWRARACVGV